MPDVITKDVPRLPFPSAVYNNLGDMNQELETYTPATTLLCICVYLYIYEYIFNYVTVS